MPSLLVVFALANLVVGTGAFVVSGILEPIAADLGVSIAAAGQATTAYALATALLAPLALVATGRWPRKRALQAALATFGLGNGICALAPDLAMLLGGRVVMGLGAMLTALAAGITVANVDAARRGRALAGVFLGISLSYVIGVPLGAWLGLELGWRVPIALVCALSLLMVLVVHWAVPDHIRAPGAGFKGAARALALPPVAWTLTLTLLYFTAIFCVFSYIGPVLRALNPLSPAELSVTLMLFGVSGAVGTLVGGFANDHCGATRTLATQLSVLGTMMALLPLTAGHPYGTLGVLLVWGTAGFGMTAPQQSRLAGTAPEQAPLLLSLNTSMLYAGSALGAALGGAASGALGFDKLSWIGVPLAALGLATLYIEQAQRRTSMA
jgi:DHA1 family inner membrane transport protein